MRANAAIVGSARAIDVELRPGGSRLSSGAGSLAARDERDAPRACERGANARSCA